VKALIQATPASEGRPVRRDALALGVQRHAQREGESMRLSTAERMVRAAIAALQAEGVPFVSVGRGFLVTHDATTIADAASLLERPALTMLARAKGLRRMASADYMRFIGDRMEQMAIDWEADHAPAEG
jgi:hypothetical protein